MFSNMAGSAPCASKKSTKRDWELHYIPSQGIDEFVLHSALRINTHLETFFDGEMNLSDESTLTRTP